MPGALITFEGPEGAGKTTQLARLSKRLREAGLAVTTAREPGGTALGQGVRGLLLSPEHRPTALAEVFLLLASRTQLCAEALRPALKRGEVVLLDRFTDSTLAYQGAGRGLSLPQLRGLNALATGGLTPALTVLLDLDPAEGLRRVQDRGVPDRLEAEHAAFHERVRRGFLELAAAEPERFLCLNARRPEDELAAAVWSRVQALRCGENSPHLGEDEHKPG